jgi:hypothetical protein
MGLFGSFGALDPVQHFVTSVDSRPNLLFPSKTGCIVEITDDTAISKMQFRSEIKISHAAKTPPPIQMFPLRFLSSDQGSRRASVATIPVAFPCSSARLSRNQAFPQAFQGQQQRSLLLARGTRWRAAPGLPPMIDKLCGKVAYAVMSFGGFLGIGEDYYPLLWSVLTFNPALDI